MKGKNNGGGSGGTNSSSESSSISFSSWPCTISTGACFFLRPFFWCALGCGVWWLTLLCGGVWPLLWCTLVSHLIQPCLIISFKIIYKSCLLANLFVSPTLAAYRLLPFHFTMTSWPGSALPLTSLLLFTAFFLLSLHKTSAKVGSAIPDLKIV